MDNETSGAIASRLSAAGKVLVVSHVRPDGDAVGSVLGIGLALQGAGKQVQMVLADGVPSAFRHLPGADQIKTGFEPGFDTFITVDCADYRRTGKLFAEVGPPDI